MVFRLQSSERFEISSCKSSCIFCASLCISDIVVSVSTPIWTWRYVLNFIYREKWSMYLEHIEGLLESCMTIFEKWHSLILPKKVLDDTLFFLLRIKEDMYFVESPDRKCKQFEQKYISKTHYSVNFPIWSMVATGSEPGVSDLTWTVTMLYNNL